MNVTLNRQKLGIEDLEWGTGTVTQTRGGEQVTITRVNAADIPYDDLQTLSQAIAPLVTQILPNLPGILATSENIDDVLIVSGNSTDISLVADNIVPVLAEVLQADTNAATATTQASIATTKASEASASATAAALSEINAALLLDMFDDRYLGQKDIDPVLDNDGDTLLVGALYFNTVSNQMRVYDGLVWTDSLTLTAGSVSVLTNKTIDDISNKIGANHIQYPVRNESGSTLLKGTVVRASATQPGNDYIVVLPVTDPQTQVALGILHNTIANNSTGLCMNTGVCADMIDTSGWTVGTILYPNATGGLTSTKPTTGNYQASAVVLRSHATQGVLLVEFTEPKYIASTTQSGYVQLNDTLTSTSTVQALTAAQGKALNDRLTTVENGVVQEGDSVTLTGDVTGTATFDSNGNVSIAATVVDDSHNHIIDNVDGLQDALDGIGTDISNLVDEVALKAYADNATLTGVPKAPTAAVGTNTTQLATTAYVKAELVSEVYSKVQLDAGQLDNRYYTETEIDAKLDAQNDASEINYDGTASELVAANVQDAIDEVEGRVDVVEGVISETNLTRADRYLVAQSVVKMIYNPAGKLSKVRYNNDTDVDYEVLTYNLEGKLANVAHYVDSVLKGNTVLSYVNGKLVSAPFTAV